MDRFTLDELGAVVDAAKRGGHNLKMAALKIVIYAYDSDGNRLLSDGEALDIVGEIIETM